MERRGRSDAGARRHFCVVTETYPPEINGVATTLAHLVSGLRARGYQVSVARPRQRVDAARPGADAAATLVAGVRLPGYRGLQIGLPAGALLRAAWRRSRPDAVYAATEGPLGWSALRRGGRPRAGGREVGPVVPAKAFG